MQLPFYSTFIVILFTVSCVTVRNYQPGKPFVFKTTINIQGNLKATEKSEMKAGLENQLDDSLKVGIVSIAGVQKKLINPAVFDTNYAIRSISFMNAFMNSKGYYEPVIKWDSTLKVKPGHTRFSLISHGKLFQHKIIPPQYRLTINFDVSPGKQLRFDSISFSLHDSALQELALRSRNKSLLRKNNPYSKQVISAEIDRLVDLFKNHGYYRASRENLYAEVDTVVAALINPFLDPLEQITLLEEVRKKRENPTINVVIKQRVPEDDKPLRQFHIRNVSIFPDLQLLDDSSKTTFDSTSRKGITVYSKTNAFKPAFVAGNTALLPARLYRQDDYFKTVNNYYKLGAWKTVTVDAYPHDSASDLDVAIRLFPAKKQSVIVDLEASRNTGDVIASSNLLGFGLNIGFRNNNVAREAIESSTTARFGIELGSRHQLIQTIQTSLTHDIVIPKAMIFFTRKNREKATDSRTILNFSGSYTDRQQFFTLGSLNGSLGFEYTYKRHTLTYIPFNIELVRLGETDSLRKLFTSIPNLRFSFNNGMVVSQQLIYKAFWNRQNKSSKLNLGFEESGSWLGAFHYVDQISGLYRFVKLNAEFDHLISFPKNAWAFRFFGGIGVPYGRQKDGTAEPSLPFFKSFVAGGPNSMRAWQVRRLGLGSSNYFDTLNQGGFDRYGDIQLEGNAEYRFNVATLKNLKIKSALFTDMGNIWYRRAPDNRPELDKAVFSFRRLYKDIAVAAGTGLRFDFDYFIIRFDWAYKIKDPVYSDTNAGWFYRMQLSDGQFQLGINYPF